MYFEVLFVHSWMRWAVALSLCIVIFRSLYGAMKKSPYTRFDNVSSIILVASTHLQVLLGFWLYFFLSPIIQLAPAGNFMKNPVLRYWKIEHFFIMLVFLILVQTSRIVGKKIIIPARRHKITAIFSIIALLVLLMGMPWQNKPYGRPLFREPSANVALSYKPVAYNNQNHNIL